LRHHQSAVGSLHVALRREVDFTLGQLFASSRVERELISALRRKQTGSEAGLFVLDNHARANRPRGDDPFVTRNAAIGRRGAVFPDQCAVAGLQTEREAVVRAEVHATVPQRRRESNRAFGKERPTLPPRPLIETINLVIRRRAEVNRVAVRHDVHGVIERRARFEPSFVVPEILIGRRRPRGLRRVASLIDPRLRKRQFELLRGDARASVVVHVRRPARDCIGQQLSGGTCFIGANAGLATTHNK
jgi:hypothetical protein